MRVLLTSWPLFDRAGGAILSRWAHILAVATWVGFLYYFNFVQIPTFGRFDVAFTNEATAKLVERAHWWTRWGASLTILSGVLLLGFQDQFKAAYWEAPAGVSVATGIFLGLVMFINNAVIVWPNEKRLIANAENISAGGEADPAAAGFGRRVVLASRTNILFSIATLFFMASASHFAPYTETSSGKRVAFLGIMVFITALLELNALGMLGGTSPGGIRAYLDTHKHTIIAGFVYTALLIILFEVFFA